MSDPEIEREMEVACITAAIAGMRERIARLEDALRLFASQHRCGCGHPACARCADDAVAAAALAPNALDHGPASVGTLRKP